MFCEHQLTFTSQYIAENYFLYMGIVNLDISSSFGNIIGSNLGVSSAGECHR
jgi:hypothetical protein